jgi:Icc protein
MTTDTLRVALIADIHYGVSTGTKLSSRALELITPFVELVDRVRPDLVVDLGDRITDLDKESDLKFTRKVVDVFHTMHDPRVHLLGNHDISKITREDLEDIMQTSFESHSLDQSGYHLVFWNSAVNRYGSDGFILPNEDVAWLEADLSSTELPAILFTHIPLDNGSMIGNFYFETVLKHFGHYKNGVDARDVIERSGKVIACLAGHTHWNSLNTIDGTHYITMHSLTESFTTHPFPAGAYGILEIDEHLTFEVFGKDPVFYRLPIKSKGYHWQNLNRDFAQKPTSLSPYMARALEVGRD